MHLAGTEIELVSCVTQSHPAAVPGDDDNRYNAGSVGELTSKHEPNSYPHETTSVLPLWVQENFFLQNLLHTDGSNSVLYAP